MKSNYSSSIGYPTVNQITSLIDSTNTYFQQYGNPDARPFYKRELSFNFSYINFRSKGLFDSFVTYVNLGSLRNALVDSIIYDGAGRAANYSINVPDAKYLKTKTEFYKAVKMNKNQLQVNGSTVFTESVQPQYINGLVTHVKNFYNENVLNLLYTLGHTFALKASQFFSWYRSDQFGANNAQLRNSVQRTIVSGSMNVPGQITFSSNITFNKITSSYVPPSTFNIWNASVTYRFLKGNKGEIKFSALDLLRQNKSVINYGAGNTLTIGNVNVLKQYYILTLAFYPRKFGRNGNQ
ncbi:hypothetical protein [Mucilaginibacter oryzae]|uniref:hypothetical protein n=1 Tax=Mucilaginibacter oryzae TaxID=468058 RepID=UPI00147339F8|nr:hypothetical protein [Mucilaginibacter oryzae]